MLNGNPDRKKFRVVGDHHTAAVVYNAAFVGYIMGGERKFIVGNRAQVKAQLKLLLEYADFKDDVSHACVFVPRRPT